MSKNFNENQLLAVQLVAQGRSVKEIAIEYLLLKRQYLDGKNNQRLLRWLTTC